jgi:hypothetical protein
MDWSPSQPNGWFPKLSPTGTHVLYGNQHVYCADLGTGQQRDLGPGYNWGWVSDTEFLYSGATGPPHVLYRVEVGVWTPTSIGADPHLPVGNWIAASPTNHWGCVLQTPNRVVFDNAVIASGGGSGGLALAGTWLVTWFNGKLRVWNNGVVHRDIIPPAGNAELAIASDGTVAYTVDGVAYLNTPANSNENVSLGIVEGSPVLAFRDGTLWLWTLNQTGTTLNGRPATVRIPQAAGTFAGGALYPTVVAKATEWVLAGTSDQGALRVQTVLFSAPAPAPPTPAPSPTPTSTTGAIPTDLGPYDRGFLLYVQGYRHLLRWSGTAWEWGPGDSGNGYISDFLRPPGDGWAACDGSETLCLQVGATLSGVRVKLPDEQSGVYHKSAAQASATVQPAVAGVVAGATAEEIGHTHPVTLFDVPVNIVFPPQTTEEETEAPVAITPGGGTDVAASPHTHELNIGPLEVRLPEWTVQASGGTGHSHGAGSLSTTGGEPAHVNVQRYFRR